MSLRFAVTVSHSGKQHAYRHAHSLQQIGALDRLITSTYYRRDRWPDRLLTFLPRLDRALQRRWLEGLESHAITRHLTLEVPELWYRNIRKDYRRAEEAMFRRDAEFDRWVAAKFAAHSELFWGFQGSCCESLKAARRTGKIAVCEFATAHVTAAIRILSDEQDRHPEWAGTISNLRFPDWYRERLEQEPLEADYCIAASSFTVRSLEEVGIPREKIKLLPLAVDIDQFSYVRRERKQGPLRVLFVGGIGQRKGIKYLLEAVKGLDSPALNLRLLGPLPADTTPLAHYAPYFEYLGQTDQAGVVNHMHQADVLVLPSVFEGFGLVIVEAMATGMPVIASTHSCAPEVIEHGVSGFVLQPDDIEGLQRCLDLLATDAEKCQQMGRAAFERAQLFSWTTHRQRLEAILMEIFDTKMSSAN